MMSPERQPFILFNVPEGLQTYLCIQQLRMPTLCSLSSMIEEVCFLLSRGKYHYREMEETVACLHQTS